MPIPSPRKRKLRPPTGAGDTPLSSNLPNLSGSDRQPGAAAPQSTAEAWSDAYRQLHDRN